MRTSSSRLALLAFLAASWAGSLLAQDRSAPIIRVYDVRHQRSEEAAELLRRRAANLPEPIDVSIDQATGSLVVSGSPAAQSFLEEALKAFDRPAAEAPAAATVPVPAAGATKIVGYAVPAQNMTAAIRFADSLAAGREDVRFTVDARTSQLLVSAPADVHRTLEKAFPTPAAAQPVQATVDPVAPATNGAAPDANGAQREFQPLAPMPAPGLAVAPAVTEFVPAQATPAAIGPGAAPAMLGPAPAVPPAPAAGTTGGVTHRLRNITADALAQFIREQWKDAIPMARDESGSKTVARMQGPEGPTGWMILDHATGEVSIQGLAPAVAAWDRIVKGLDVPPSPQSTAKLLRIERADPEQVRQAVGFLGYAQSGDVAAALPNTLNGASTRFASQTQPAPDPFAPNQPDGVPPVDPRRNPAPPAATPNRTPPAAAPMAPADQPDIRRFGPNAEAGQEGAEAALAEATQGAGAIGSVRIEFVEGLDAIIIRGAKEDVERVTRLIEEIDRLSATTQPRVEVLQLEHVASEPLSELVTEIYDEILSPRQGQVVIRPLGKPNAILLIGRPESVAVVKELIEQLDQPSIPSAAFRVFRLKHMSAIDASNRLTTFYEERGGLGVRVAIVPDYRSNSVIVQAGPRDMLEIAQLLDSIDVVEAGAVNEVKIFRLTNAVATDLAPLLQDAINGQLRTAGQGLTQGTGGAGGQTQQIQQQAGGGAAGTASNDSAQVASQMLTFLTVDPEGKRMLRSGILFGVRVGADVNSNSLVITGPSEGMALIGALIEALDQLPDVEAQVKVFTIVNGDATTLVETLDALFGTTTTTGGGGAGGGSSAANGFGNAAALAADAGDNSVAPLKFAVDVRSNSIVATGSPGSLEIVERILIRLDESNEELRRTTVYRLRNSPATEIAEAINAWIEQRSELVTADPRNISEIQQIDRQLIVVEEPITNSLIVSATDRFYDEVERLIEQLDSRPPMINIQVLIAEVTLGDFEEFGVELGLQDSILLGNPLGGTAAGAQFNDTENLAGQGLSGFALGRTNNTLGYGGLVLAAGNESVSILLRTLQDQQRLSVLSKPQVMTLDNQEAFVQVGQRVPRVTAVNQNANGGVTNSVELDDVGILLGVTPRTSPDGLVVMEIDVERSSVGPISQGIPIFVDADGNAVNSPIFNVTTAQTTVSARSGQTIVLSGLITKSNSISSRKVPYLSDVPILGRLFRYDAVDDDRTELLIVMTPYIVNREEEADMLREMESERMNWCLGDVVELIGDNNLRSRMGWAGAEPVVIYPDRDPTGAGIMDPAFEDAIRGRLDAACEPGAPTGAGPAPTDADGVRLAPGEILLEGPTPLPGGGPTPVPNGGPTPGPTPAPGPYGPVPHSVLTPGMSTQGPTQAPPGLTPGPPGLTPDVRTLPLPAQRPPAGPMPLQQGGAQAPPRHAAPPQVIRPQPVQLVPDGDMKTEVYYGAAPDRSVRMVPRDYPGMPAQPAAIR